jgi:hypothetical protein
MVNTLITVLPASEDFDGLVTALEDAMDGFWTVTLGIAVLRDPCHITFVLETLMNNDLLIINYKDGTSQTLKMYHLLIVLPFVVFLFR